ncbi:hypothetical protein MRX96_043235 [Rhipicephalus microplus]
MHRTAERVQRRGYHLRAVAATDRWPPEQRWVAVPSAASRQNRSEIKKRRRDKMNMYISEMTSLMSMCKAMSRKLDKLAVLRMVVQHIKTIRDLDLVNSFVSLDILTAGSQQRRKRLGGHGGHHELAGSGRWTWWTGGLQWNAVVLALKHPFALLFTRTSRELFLASNGEEYSIYEHSCEDIAVCIHSEVCVHYGTELQVALW